jgi:hypothetical protein
MNDLLVKIILEIGKQILYAIPNAIEKWRFGKFFGSHALSGENVFAVVDPYSHPLPRTGNRYIKHFMNRKQDSPLIGEDNVLGVNVVRVITYVSATFSKYRKITNPIKIVTDEEVEKKWNGTFICFGSSDSNIKTYDTENLSQQSFYKFDFMSNGFRGFTIDNNTFCNKAKQDYGVLLKLKNPYNHEHFLFVCAGLGEWGTSGSAYYLFDKWKQLYKRHKERDFCKIIEVDIGSDESGREVFSSPN